MAISVENSKFFLPTCIFGPAEGFPWNWVPALGVKKYCSNGATGPRKKFDDIFSLLDTVHERVRRSDTGWQHIPRLRIASRGKNRFSAISEMCSLIRMWRIL